MCVLFSVMQASAETEQVKFKCTASVEFGATMKVVGDSDALGNWEVENGVEMQWSPGDVWTAFVFLRPGTYQLKVGSACRMFLWTFNGKSQGFGLIFR